MNNMRVFIVGLGLIGGSFARVLNQTGQDVVAYDTDRSVLEQALCDGAINTAAEYGQVGELLTSADITICCLCPNAAIEFYTENAENIKAGVLYVDIAGVKQAVCNSLFPLFREKGAHFFGCHPMAGKEYSGYINSDAKLFCGASFIAVRDIEHPDPGGQRAAFEKLSSIVRQAGFSKITETDAETHDRIIAYTSQLPHLSAAAYMLDSYAREHEGFSAGSYRDMSRVARLNADMWSELFSLNSDNLTRTIDCYIANLERLKAAAKSGGGQIAELLKAASRIKEETHT